MQIMAVTPFDKRRSKVLISEDFAFVLYNGEIRRYHIEEGAELTEERYRQILDEVLRKRARERAIYLLKEKDRTEAELTKKLREGFYPEEVIREVLELFKTRHYIDDEEYGRCYLDNHSQKKSRRRLQYDLQRKGLDRDQIEELLEEIEVPEEDQIREFLQKKGYDPEQTDQKEKGKLMMALARKGFAYEAIRSVMGEWLDT